jgi:small subunit ribosomal protein S6
MWILGANSTEADGQASVERLKTAVSARGGQVKSAEFWGRRTLAYPVKGSREGAYYVARFSVEGNQAPEIERAVYADQTVIRHVLVQAAEVEEQPEAVPAQAATAGATAEMREQAPTV